MRKMIICDDLINFAFQIFNWDYCGNVWRTKLNSKKPLLSVISFKAFNGEWIKTKFQIFFCAIVPREMQNVFKLIKQLLEKEIKTHTLH